MGPGLAGDRVLGLLSQTTANLDQAAAHFDDALAFCRKAGYRPELAWTCCDYADTLLQRRVYGAWDLKTASQYFVREVTPELIRALSSPG